MLLPVIMAGGSGTRLWPLSRQFYPKQFHALTGERTMLHETITRLDGLKAETPLVICNEEQRFLAAEQMRVAGQGEATILLEPFGRNTAPAIALAALKATADGSDPVLLVLAADHHIRHGEAFRDCVRKGLALAKDGKLVTFGIVPTHAETGYGYIEKGGQVGDGFAVAAFTEKPDADTAARYIADGSYFWNSGMFMFRAGRYLEELEKFRPDILDACRKAMAETHPDMQFVRVDAEAFASCPAESVDYAVMEKTCDAVVLPLDADWSDIGSWSALLSVQERDGDGNSLSGDVMAIDTRNTLARADGRLVALVGVDDLVVVETKDALLVAHRDKVQDVRRIVEELEAAGRSEHLNHRDVYRPWGHYDSIDVGERDQVKRITVNPGAKLSVQMHHHRSEHWVVVRGTAKVQKGEEMILVSENESVYIPVGAVHALENPGKIPLELIEVQTGSYLGEDDIVRFEDRYGRS
ncbi:mannose-1-phosphate guanylyltransferase/mannose-6-phosphate isomerase [Aliihoeflea sp. PC F10.4]